MRAVVVGSSGSIGSATVARLANRHIVLGIDKNPEVAKCHRFFQISLRSETAVLEAMNWLADQGDFPSVFIFAAGSYNRVGIECYEVENLTELFWDNFLSVFFFCKAILPQLIRNGGGRIIMISSQATVGGGLDSAYASSKAALVALMKSIAREFGRHNVICNAVSPGPVDTPMAEVMGKERKDFYRTAIPIGRLIDADEVAELISFLAESSGRAINGSTVDIDGGMFRR